LPLAGQDETEPRGSRSQRATPRQLGDQRLVEGVVNIQDSSTPSGNTAVSNPQGLVVSSRGRTSEEPNVVGAIGAFSAADSDRRARDGLARGSITPSIPTCGRIVGVAWASMGRIGP